MDRKIRKKNSSIKIYSNGVYHRPKGDNSYPHCKTFEEAQARLLNELIIVVDEKEIKSDNDRIDVLPKTIFIFIVMLIIGYICLMFLNTDVVEINQEKEIIKITDTQKDTTAIKRASVYNAVVSQCDGNPFVTADGSKIDNKKLESGELRWVALSRDLIDNKYRSKLHPGTFKGEYKFGDTIRVESKTHPYMNGSWVVRDCMNKRYKSSIDFLIPLKGRKLLGRDFKICKI